jgi:hypothetical protein
MLSTIFKTPCIQSCLHRTYVQKPGFFAGIGDEPQGYFQKVGFSATLRKSYYIDKALMHLVPLKESQATERFSDLLVEFLGSSYGRMTSIKTSEPTAAS